MACPFSSIVYLIFHFVWIPLHRNYNLLNVPDAKLVEALAHADAGNSGAEHDHMEVGRRRRRS